MDAVTQSFADKSFYTLSCHNKLIFCFVLSMSSLHLSFCDNPLKVISIIKVICFLILYVIMGRVAQIVFNLSSI